MSYECRHRNTVVFGGELSFGHRKSVKTDFMLEEDLVLSEDHDSTGDVEEAAEKTNDGADMAGGSFQSHFLIKIY